MDIETPKYQTLIPEIFDILLSFSANVTFIGLFLRVSKNMKIWIASFISCKNHIKPNFLWVNNLLIDFTRILRKNETKPNSYHGMRSLQKQAFNLALPCIIEKIAIDDIVLFYIDAETKNICFAQAMYHKGKSKKEESHWVLIDNLNKSTCKKTCKNVFAWDPITQSLEQWRRKYVYDNRESIKIKNDKLVNDWDNIFKNCKKRNK